MWVLPVKAIGPVSRQKRPYTRIAQHLARALHPLHQNLAGIAAQELRRPRGNLRRLQSGADDIGRLAAFGRGDQQVVAAKAELHQVTGTIVGKVFETFERMDERDVAAGHQGEDLVRSRKSPSPQIFERKRKPSRGAAADEENPVARRKRCRNSMEERVQFLAQPDDADKGVEIYAT